MKECYKLQGTRLSKALRTYYVCHCSGKKVQTKPHPVHIQLCLLSSDVARTSGVIRSDEAGLNVRCECIKWINERSDLRMYIVCTSRM